MCHIFLSLGFPEANMDGQHAPVQDLVSIPNRRCVPNRVFHFRCSASPDRPGPCFRDLRERHADDFGGR